MLNTARKKKVPNFFDVSKFYKLYFLIKTVCIFHLKNLKYKFFVVILIEMRNNFYVNLHFNNRLQCKISNKKHFREKKMFLITLKLKNITILTNIQFKKLLFSDKILFLSIFLNFNRFSKCIVIFLLF